MKKRITNFFLLTIILLLCGMVEGFAPFTLEHAAAKGKTDALSQAKNYISFTGFSREGLIKQLEFEGYSQEEATYGADNCGADWNDMAVKKAKSYTSGDYFAYSENGLIKQLEYEGFTPEEASYGAANCGADWNDMAIKKAESYMRIFSFTESDLIRQLEFDGYTEEQISYALGIHNNSLNSGESAYIPTAVPTNIPTTSPTNTLTAIPTNTPTEIPTKAPTSIPDTSEVSDQMITVLSKNIDNIFVIRGLEEAFNSPMPAQYSDVGAATVVDISNQDGMRHISLYANSDDVHDYSSITKLNAGNLQNFYFEMEVHVNDVYPSGSGGCFIGYTNETTSAVQTEEIKTIGLLVDGHNAEFYVKEKNAESGEHIQISRSDNYTYKLVLIRFTGQTFAYIDGKFVGQHHDDETGPFQLVFGASVFRDGDNALCSFDNLNIRKVIN